MKLRIWNAYASNNSGSYTIVGSFPDAELAADVAEVLDGVVRAHAAWVKANEWTGDGEGSPLAEFCRAHGMSWQKGVGVGEEWPYAGGDNTPRVAAIDHHVVVHHAYTVTLPRTFGEYFYKRGGRVDVEHDHAHHPLVTIVDFWYLGEDEVLASLIAKLLDERGPLFTHADPSFAPAWRDDAKPFDGAPFRIAAVFGDLVAGTAAVTAIARAAQVHTTVRVMEAFGAEGDPMAFLRPSSPVVPRFDVRLIDLGTQRQAVLDTIIDATGFYGHDVRERLEKLPTDVVRMTTGARAKQLAEVVERAGGAVEIVRNDG